MHTYISSSRYPLDSLSVICLLVKSRVHSFYTINQCGSLSLLLPYCGPASARSHGFDTTRHWHNHLIIPDILYYDIMSWQPPCLSRYALLIPSVSFLAHSAVPSKHVCRHVHLKHFLTGSDSRWCADCSRDPVTPGFNGYSEARLRSFHCKTVPHPDIRYLPS